MNASPSTLREELHPLLVARIRIGAVLVLVSILLFGLLELWQRHAPLGPFFAVKALQIVAVVVVWLALDARGPWRRSVALALALVVEVCATLAWSGILAGEVASAPLLCILVALGCATLLPWGLGPQALTVGVAATAMVANVLWVPMPDGFGYSATAACLSFLASLCVAHELEQQRRQRYRAEQEERASANALRDEILVAETTADAARVLLAGGDVPHVLDTLCGLQTRLLSCDASYTFLRDRHDTKSFVAAARAGDSSAEWDSRRSLRIPDIGLARMIDRLDRDEPLVVDDDRGILPVDGRVCIYTALMAGRDVVGIQVAVRRRPQAFSTTDVEIARRLAHTASAAFAQAERFETHRPGADVGGRVWHELQTPLTSILRFSEHAADLSLPTAERRALLTRIASTARDMLRMLERLEQPTRPASGPGERTARH
jgi:signal transduction histidine kinase